MKKMKKMNKIFKARTYGEGDSPRLYCDGDTDRCVSVGTYGGMKATKTSIHYTFHY